MKKQVSANDGIDAARLWCVQSVKCMHQVKRERSHQSKKKRSFLERIYKRLPRCKVRAYKRCNIFINDISCSPKCVKLSEALGKVDMQLMSRGERTHKKADRWLALRWAEVRRLYYLLVLTGWHIYSSGVHAKIIGHGARDSQVRSGHNLDPVCYLSVDEGTLVQLHEKTKCRVKSGHVWFLFWIKRKKLKFRGMYNVCFIPLGGDVGSMED